MRPKVLVGLLGGAVGFGGCGGGASLEGPTIYVQMAMYSAFVIFPVLLGSWTHRHQPRFWSGIALLLGAHALFLLLIRSIFPFRSIWAVVPLILLEAIGAFVFLLRWFGDRDNAEIL